MGTSFPLATWAIPCSKLCLAPLKALIRAAWFASSDRAALLLPKVANPKAITNSRFLMLTSCVLRRIALLETALSWPSVILAGAGKFGRPSTAISRPLFHRLIDDLEFFALQEQHGG